MPEITKESFESTIDALISAPAKSSTKGDAFKQWFQSSFGDKASIARINEDRQIGNRIVEQYSHHDSAVVFVCEPGVQMATVCRRVSEKHYPGLTAVLLIGAQTPYTYLHLYSNKKTAFVKWVIDKLGLEAENFENLTNINLSDMPLQLITYGAPGTGKSHKTDAVVQHYSDTVRTTFHPDSDYATFIGSYKPNMEKRIKYGLQGQPITANGKALEEDVIVYKFIPQAFTKAYVRAWKKMAASQSGGECEPQFLVIEEINRGNCAQVFGDIFQLLDRGKDGYSKYGIEADSSLANFIASELQSCGETIPADIKSGAILKFPPNLYIWATMNTSDQSLFPMDSAFKRRWEWAYVPISNHSDQNWEIVADGQKFPWWKFLERINKSILDATKSEDKQLGYFFAIADNAREIDCRKFVNKVLFYLYNDVFKDYYLPKGFCKDEGEPFAFRDFFLADGKPDEKNVSKLLTRFLSDE